MFALVAFARRPLDLDELFEAIGILWSRDAHELDSDEKPDLDSMRMQEFAPLIQVEKSSGNPTRYTCRLLHSTVLDFLQRNPNALCHGGKDGTSETPRFTQSTIAQACLLYLSQGRFSDLLCKQDGNWIDASGKPVEDHHFLTYAAKYWYKHLDGIHEPDEQMQWDSRIQQFVSSPNFKTCLQIQSLWVEVQFGNFRDSQGRSYFRRAFPDWFAKSEAGLQVARDYDHFLYDWQHFLDACSGPLVPPFAGELDRCWWTTLHPRNFLAQATSRYSNLRLQTNADVVLCPRQRFEGIASTGREVKVLQLK